MDVKFGTPADASTCSTDAVQCYPGQPCFASNEYEGFSEFVADPIPCLRLPGEPLLPAVPIADGAPGGAGSVTDNAGEAGTAQPTSPPATSTTQADEPGCQSPGRCWCKLKCP